MFSSGNHHANYCFTIPEKLSPQDLPFTRMMAARKGPSAEGSAENNSNVSAHFSSEHAPKKSPNLNNRSPLSAENTRSKSNSTGNARRRAKSMGHQKRRKATLGSQENDKRPSAETPKTVIMQPKVKKKYGRKGTPLLQPKARLQDNYVVEAMIGGGGFGQVYRAFHEVKGIHVAVKVEPKDHEPGRMILEQSILTELRGFPNAPTLYGSGSVDNINFIIMEILGANLSDLRKKQPEQRLSVGSGMRCILQGCTALRTLHGIGYIHRDVKPSNFCIGEKGFQRRIVYLVDFGLSRKYRDKHGNLRRQRRVAEFRGTLKYVSVNVHRKKDQGPVDDFISLYYSAVEITEGNLPWRLQRDVRAVEKAKLDFRLDEYVKYVHFCCHNFKLGAVDAWEITGFRHLPCSFRQFYDILEPLSYKDELNYDLIQEIIKDSLPSDITDASLYDWEATGSASAS